MIRMVALAAMLGAFVAAVALYAIIAAPRNSACRDRRVADLQHHGIARGECRLGTTRSGFRGGQEGDGGRRLEWRHRGAQVGRLARSAQCRHPELYRLQLSPLAGAGAGVRAFSAGADLQSAPPRGTSARDPPRGQQHLPPRVRAPRGGDQRVRLLEQRQAGDPRHARPAGQRGRGSRRCTGWCASSRPRPASRCPGCTSRRPRRPTPSPPAATRATPPSAAPRASSRMLDERELRGVIGHELMHVYNRDILISSVAAAIAPHVIMFLVNFAWLIPVGGADDDDGPGILGMLLVMHPRPARRHRHPARRSAAPASTRRTSTAPQLTGDPLALASALRKLEAGTQQLPLPPEPQARDREPHDDRQPVPPGQGMSRLFSTHPPMAERIARLEQMATATASTPDPDPGRAARRRRGARPRPAYRVRTSCLRWQSSGSESTIDRRPAVALTPTHDGLLRAERQLQAAQLAGDVQVLSGCSTTAWWRSGRTARGTPRMTTSPPTAGCVGGLRAGRGGPGRCSWRGPRASRSSSGGCPAPSRAGR